MWVKGAVLAMERGGGRREVVSWGEGPGAGVFLAHEAAWGWGTSLGAQGLAGSGGDPGIFAPGLGRPGFPGSCFGLFLGLCCRAVQNIRAPQPRPQYEPYSCSVGSYMW